MWYTNNIPIFPHFLIYIKSQKIMWLPCDLLVNCNIWSKVQDYAATVKKLLGIKLEANDVKLGK